MIQEIKSAKHEVGNVYQSLSHAVFGIVEWLYPVFGEVISYR